MTDTIVAPRSAAESDTEQELLLEARGLNIGFHRADGASPSSASPGPENP
jgi:hypothetical protein